MTAKSSDNRKALITKIHIGKNELKLDEDTYRQLLQGLTGKASCRLMTEYELNKVLTALKQRGFLVRSKFKERPMQPAEHKKRYLSKIKALLCEYQLPDSYAHKIAKQAFGIDFVHWLAVWQLKKVIQMLAVYHQRQQKQAKG